MSKNRLRGKISDGIWRGKLFGLVSVALLFLFPITGWIPLLLLWCVHLFFLGRASDNRASKWIYWGAFSVLVLLIILNIVLYFCR